MGKNGNFRLTRLERNWILYDVGNSAFVLMVATLIPIFFNALAESGGLTSVEYLAYWGYASSVVTIITAILSPILGTVADTRGFKKPIFMLCVGVGIVGCCAMGAASAWLPFLVIFVIAKVGFSGSLVFYDSMLGDVTTPERMDEVSSRGYAWGYIGSCVPFVVCLGLVLGAGAIGLSQMTALNIALILTAVWWLVTTLPLLKSYRQLHYVEVEEHAVCQSFVRIGQTLRHLPEDKQVFWFLLAFFCYIDGVYTIIDMATAYGTALGLDTTGLLLALLVTAVQRVSLVEAHSGLYRGLCGHRGVCVLSDPAVAVLGAGRHRGDVPRRRTGPQPLPLRKDYPAGEVGRVLRAFRHLRQGGILPRDDDRQRGEPADRQRQCGRRLPHRAVRCGIRVVPGVLSSGRDGINFIKNGNGESCPAQLSFYCDF